MWYVYEQAEKWTIWVRSDSHYHWRYAVTENPWPWARAAKLVETATVPYGGHYSIEAARQAAVEQYEEAALCCSG